MNHLVGDVVGKVFLQIGMAFEKRQMALIGDAVKIIDLGDKAIPVLPEDLIASIGSVPLAMSV